MNLLLDTHVFLWAATGGSQLSAQALAAIQDGKNVVFVSAATAWEIAIKKGLGKLTVPNSDYFEELRLNRFTPLDITSSHALAVEKLPPLHRDPFDRILVAQAQLEKLTLVTRDVKVMQYDVPIIEA